MDTSSCDATVLFTNESKNRHTVHRNSKEEEGYINKQSIFIKQGDIFTKIVKPRLLFIVFNTT